MQRETIQEFRKKRNRALTYLQEQTEARPPHLIILGTGLGHLANKIDAQETVSYADIPHFPLSTVESHEGRLIFGRLSGKEVIAMQGRFHYYEGYSMQQIAFPVRVLHALSADTMIVSNACGGMHPHYRSGDIMLISDHINMLGDNPLIGPNDEELGPRFPDMSDPYSERLQRIAEQVALDNAIKMHKGIYLALSGPAMETRAEYRFLRMIGADVVGMSTVPEVIAAVHMGMEVLGISAVTDECFPDVLEPINVEKVMEAAGNAEPGMTQVVTGVLDRM